MATHPLPNEYCLDINPFDIGVTTVWVHQQQTPNLSKSLNLIVDAIIEQP